MENYISEIISALVGLLSGATIGFKVGVTKTLNKVNQKNITAKGDVVGGNKTGK